MNLRLQDGIKAENLFGMKSCWDNFYCSEEQCKKVQKEFLDVYFHYHTQMATLSETMAEQIDYLIRGMVDHFEDENPYIVSYNIRTLI